MITSTKNQQIKRLHNLIKKAKARNEEKVFIVEGVKMFEEAPGELVEAVYVSESFYKAYENKELLDEMKAEILTDSVFESVSDTQTPQGVMCIVKQPEYELNQVINNDRGLLLILDEIKDPGNMGTLIRTAEGAGVTGIIIRDLSVDIFNPKVIRSTMGSVFRMPFAVVSDLPQTVRQINEAGYITFAAYLDNSNDYCMRDYTGKTGFIIGNESRGISKEVLEAASENIKIPMEGRVESLNASVAGSLLMYEAYRQRRNA